VTIAENESVPAKTLAQKLDYLFQLVHPGRRGEFTHKEVADEIAARGGPTISATYVWELRTGRKDNPTLKHIEALAQFFHVPPAYFLDENEAKRIDAELELLGALRDASVRHMALRAAGLSPESLGTITEMIERVRQLEGLPDPPQHDHRSEKAPDT
jgi:transcriptional regulator with XRE-family HTH domain